MVRHYLHSRPSSHRSKCIRDAAARKAPTEAECYLVEKNDLESRPRVWPHGQVHLETAHQTLVVPPTDYVGQS